MNYLRMKTQLLLFFFFFEDKPLYKHLLIILNGKNLISIEYGVQIQKLFYICKLNK